MPGSLSTPPRRPTPLPGGGPGDGDDTGRHESRHRLRHPYGRRPAADIFDLLATPSRHSEFDGSGSVRGVQERTPERLSAGAKFGMQMRIGLPYKILNEVVEFDEPTRIAWQHFGGHVWRYLLEPLDDQHTRVTEQFDTTGSRAPVVLALMRAKRANARSINATLDRLQRWARDRP